MKLFPNYFSNDFQIKKLQQENYIIEARFATFKLSTGVDGLKEQVKKLKEDLSTFKSKYSRLNIDYEDVKEKYEQLKIKHSIVIQKPSMTDAFSQTDPPKFGATFVEQMDLQRAIQRAEKYKKAYDQAAKTFNELKEKYIKLDAEHSEMSKVLEEMKPKYTETKRICNHRYTVIMDLEKAKEELQQSEAALKAELDVLKEKLVQFEEIKNELSLYQRKYDMAKKICDNRRHEIVRLTTLLEENGVNNENVPQNK